MQIIKKFFRLCYLCIKAPFVLVFNIFGLLLHPSRIKNAFVSLFGRGKQLKSSMARSNLSHTNPFAHWILWATLLCVIIFLIWSKFAILEEVTVAPATVIPLSHVQIIQNMEGGIIKSIPVHEGDIVEKGQVLVYLDPTRFLSALSEAKARAFSLEVKIARLTAETNEKPFLVSIGKNIDASTMSLLKSEQQLYESRQNQITQLQKNRSLAMQELAMTRPLVAAGAASQVEVLHLERQVSDISNQLADFHSRALNDLEAAKSDYATVTASMLALQDRVNRTTIRAPVKGIVKQIRIASRLGVVPPGSEIMSIVPLEDSLLIEAQVKPADIGFIHPGQSVSIKITAYDYSIYGGLSGEVDQVSADTITDAKGRAYYLVRIKAHKNYLRTAENPLYIIPGMTASVDILTGKRTVLNYLISPLLKAQQNALRER